MFLAMNRFRIARGCEEEFVEIWRSRDTFLDGVPGFRRFHLLAGPVTDECALYASHSEWDSREDFENWTRSEAFRRAHADVRPNKALYIGPPELELFDQVL